MIRIRLSNCDRVLLVIHHLRDLYADLYIDTAIEHMVIACYPSTQALAYITTGYPCLRAGYSLNGGKFAVT